jgi:hypothetical protein
LRYCDRRFGQLQRVRAGRDLKFPHRLAGDFTCFMLLYAGRRCLRQFWHSGHLIEHNQWEHSSSCAPRLCSKASITLVGYSRFARELQGGGVWVESGSTVIITSSSITGNTATYVRAHAQNSPQHRPHGRLTFYSLSAGWRFLCWGWHSGGLIVHHQWEHSYSTCARNIAKFPIALVG